MNFRNPQIVKVNPLTHIKETSMWINVIHFCSVFFTALALGASMAHVLELPNKIHLPKDQYAVVQQLYKGWALLGIVVVIALIATLALVILTGHQRKTFALTLTGLLCIAATQIIFWIFTYPVNRKTKNWTIFPENWYQLRKQWEYSHASGAVFNLLALVALTLSLLLHED
jgi:hypothetical protein